MQVRQAEPRRRPCHSKWPYFRDISVGNNWAARGLLLDRSMRSCSPYVVVLVLLAAGCNDREPPLMILPSPPLPLDELCRELAGAWCDARSRCDCNTDLQCLENLTSQCEQSVVHEELRAAIDAGRIIYDQAAAGRLVDAFSAPDICDAEARWNYPESLSLNGVFVGTKAAGEECVDDLRGRVSECAGGTCDVDVCIGFVGAGQPCDNRNICTNLDVPFTPGGGRPSLSCEQPFGTEQGLCATPRPVGAGCEVGSDCESGHCDDELSRCALREEGQRCRSSSECLSGQCDRGTCSERGGIGAACASSDDCRSFSCLSGRCTAPACNLPWAGLPIGF